MPILNLWDAVRTKAPLVIGLTILGLVAGLLLGARQSPVYEATARIAVGPSQSVDDVNDRIQVGQVLNRTVVPSNLSELLVSQRVLLSAAEASGITVDELSAIDVDAAVSPESNVVYLTVVARSADHPAKMVDGITTDGSELFESIYSVYRAEPIQVDREPTVQNPLSTPIAGLIGAIVGGVLGLYAALIIHRVQSEAAHRQGRTDLDPAPSNAELSEGASVPDEPEARSSVHHHHWGRFESEAWGSSSGDVVPVIGEPGQSDGTAGSRSEAAG